MQKIRKYLGKTFGDEVSVMKDREERNDDIADDILVILMKILM